MGEIIQNVLARRYVHPDIVPFLGRDLREPALHQRLSGRDDLDDGSMAGLEIAIDRTDQRRRLHACQQMAEEALLGKFKGGPRRRLRLRIQRAGLAGDVRGLHRGVEIVVND